MQNVNKFPIRGNNQEQENNYRFEHHGRPSVRIESDGRKTVSQSPQVGTSRYQEDSNHLQTRGMSYVPTGTIFQSSRVDHDQRDGAFTAAAREEMIEWDQHVQVTRDGSAFITLPYRRESVVLAPTGPEHVNWRYLPGVEWRRAEPPASLLREPPVSGEPVQVPTQSMSSSRSPWATGRMTNTKKNSPVATPPSGSLSRVGFPTVAQINRHNQIQHFMPTRVKPDARPGITNEVQAISMSSSNGSSTTGSPPSYGPKQGEKRVSQATPATTTVAAPLSKTSTFSRNSANKRLKPSARTDSAGFGMLDLLCSATLEIGPLQDNPSGCSCPKSKCIALYCDCFKAGRRCNPGTCTCLDCKNTVEESGIHGARTKAIRTILARNPRAFTTAGMGNPPPKELPDGKVACNCIRSRCLKLYCGCFQAGSACEPDVCTCISCLNTQEDTGGQRQAAIQNCLEKRPNAFQVKPKEVGSGCACKNNRCIRKYCECFRTGLSCTEKCICRECENTQSK